MTTRTSSRLVAVLFAANVLACGSHPAEAAFLPIYGGPTYDSSSHNGYLNPLLPSQPGSTAGSGIAVGNVFKVGNNGVGPRAVRWDASGAAATELGHLGTSGTYAESGAWAVNSTDTAVGYAVKYDAGVPMGNRAVRWNASSTTATELGNLGVLSDVGTTSQAYAINDTGTAVGFAFKYVGDIPMGDRAVRWDASGTAATELENLGTQDNGITISAAYAINDAGTAVGFALKFVAGANLGPRAVRWDASGTAATELGHLGAHSSGTANAIAIDVNDAGTAVGSGLKYVADIDQGSHAVRWDASGTEATELEHLGTNSSGLSGSGANAVNNAGTAVGFSEKYVAGITKGVRAVRWDASGTAVTELGNLGADSSGFTYSNPYAINDAGTPVGFAAEYDSSGTFLGERAVMWGLDALPIDLNTLIDPASGWVNLSRAYDISNDNWITGIGVFDPDGPGGLDQYDRLFLLHIPEPNTVTLLGLALAVGLVTNRLRHCLPTQRTRASDQGCREDVPALRRAIRRRALLARGALVVALSAAEHSHALPPPTPYLPVFGGPTYDSSTGTGYRDQTAPQGSSTGSGVAVGNANGDNGFVAVRWDASGTPATELESLGISSHAWAINSAGTTVGFTYYEAGDSMGDRAVRWGASGAAATELGHLGVDSTGSTGSQAVAINDAGTAVGYALKFVADTFLGSRAVRWDASGTAATELGHLGTSNSAVTGSEATAINEVGVVVGWADKWDGDTTLGQRAVRWDASGTATELGHIGSHSSGQTDSIAFAMNDAGTAVGRASKYVADIFLGSRAVRWDASGTVATELGHLGTDSTGFTSNQATAINNTGTAVGEAIKYVAGNELGPRAVRWEASGTTATELGHLGTDSAAYTFTRALAINDAGTAVGFADAYDGSGAYLGARAAMWGLDGVAIDLNTLIDPARGWLSLTDALDISNDNWITGTGVFDPDGPGGLDEYERLFLLHIPEPHSFTLSLLGLSTLLIVISARGNTFHLDGA